MKDIVVTARIDGQTHKNLVKLARQQDRSMSYLLRKAAENYVKAQCRGTRTKEQES